MRRFLIFAVLILCGIGNAAPIRSMIGAKYSMLNATSSSEPLPEGMVAVEYLQSSQTQWIDTGLPGNMQRLTIDLKIYPVTWRRYGGMVGNFVANAANAVRLGFADSDNSKVIMGANCKGGQSTGSDGLYVIYVPNLKEHWHDVHFDIDASRVRIDDVATTSSSVGTDNSTTIRLFNGGSGSNGSSVRISSFVAYQNGVKIRHLIPVRYDNVGCMYDLVSREVFYNKGTGTFIIGPDL